MRNTKTCLVASAAALMLSMSASAAVVDKDVFSQLIAEAKKNGAAAVQVHLKSVGLDRIASDLKGVNAEMSARQVALLNELGANAWSAGRWDNGLGQAGFFANETGLRILAASSNAVSFTSDAAVDRRLGLDHPDGRGEGIRRLLDRDGTVEVVVTPNVEGLEFDTSSTGAVTLRLSAAQEQEALDKGRNLLNALPAAHAPGKAAALSSLPLRSGSLAAHAGHVMRVTREGLIAIASSPLVRNVQLSGHMDTRPSYFEEAVMRAAASSGSAQVVVTLRSGFTGTNLSSASREAQKRSMKRDLDAVLQSAGITSDVHAMPEFGAFTGTLTHGELTRLRNGKDARLLSVVENKPLGTVQLATSTATMNVRKYWDNPGYPVRGSGQWVVVMDSGVDKTHPFFLGSDGRTRVKYEGCFGTNKIVGSTNYISRCPSADAKGDSPLNLAGSGMPISACAADLSPCVHGTHVAGIVGGSQYLTGVPSNNPPDGVQGVAPAVNLVSFNVLSYDQARSAAPTFFADDLLAALQTVIDNMDKGSTSNPFTVNMSLGGRNPVNGTFASGPCDSWPDYAAIGNAVRTLYSLGVPVIAATGNEYQSLAMKAPACLSKVIKVSSVLNDGVGKTRSNFANVAPPSQFPGETMWFAPGGGDDYQGTKITSSIPYSYSSKFHGMVGTSQAAPHVSGLYALAKGYMPPGQPAWTVAGVTAYFAANAAVPVTVNPCTSWVGPPNCPYTPFQVNALRLP